MAAVNEMDWVNVMCYDFDYANVRLQRHDQRDERLGDVWGAQEQAGDGVAVLRAVWDELERTHSKSYGDSVAYGSSTFVHILSDYQSINGSAAAAECDSYMDENGNVIYFNGVNTIQKKMAFVRDNGFGGAMIWELEYDHWNSSNQYDSYSLLPVISSMLRPPSWLTPASGSSYDLVNGQFLTSGGTMTLNAERRSANPDLNISVGAASTMVVGASQASRVDDGGDGRCRFEEQHGDGLHGRCAHRHVERNGLQRADGR